MATAIVALVLNDDERMFKKKNNKNKRVVLDSSSSVALTGRGACGVRRAACGVRRAAGNWVDSGQHPLPHAASSLDSRWAEGIVRAHGQAENGFAVPLFRLAPSNQTNKTHPLIDRRLQSGWLSQGWMILRHPVVTAVVLRQESTRVSVAMCE